MVNSDIHVFDIVWAKNIDNTKRIRIGLVIAEDLKFSDYNILFSDGTSMWCAEYNLSKTDYSFDISEVFAQIDSIGNRTYDNNGLKSCPFCGGKAELRKVFNEESSSKFGRCYVRCTNCFIGTDCMPSENEAISLWNKRS